ncbi:MAG: hypothetical protein NVS4B3_00640 [Gemmatimonadaceae bacterium]
MAARDESSDLLRSSSRMIPTERVVEGLAFVGMLWAWKRSLAQEGATAERLDTELGGLARARGWRWGKGLDAGNGATGFARPVRAYWVIHGEATGALWRAMSGSHLDMGEETPTTRFEARFAPPTRHATQLRSTVDESLLTRGLVGIAEKSIRNDLREKLAQKELPVGLGVTAAEYAELLMPDPTRPLALPEPLASRGFTGTSLRDSSAFLAAFGPALATFYDGEDRSATRPRLTFMIVGDQLSMDLSALTDRAQDVDAYIRLGIAAIEAAKLPVG